MKDTALAAAKEMIKTMEGLADAGTAAQNGSEK